jgi:hypothetical protein
MKVLWLSKSFLLIGWACLLDAKGMPGRTKPTTAIETVSKPPTKTKTAIATDKNLEPQVSYCLSVARLGN